MTKKTWEIIYKFHYICGLFLMALVATALYLTHNTRWNMAKVLKVDFKKFKKIRTQCTTKCDYFSGTWIYDNISHPVYKESQCSFIEDHFACQQNGRTEFKYQNWRWQPHHCDLPRFDGKSLLEKLRGKKLVFVGDSLNINTYQSMLCLIEPYLPPFTNKTIVLTGNLYTFQIKDYNATIEFYWAPMLVESNCDDPIKHSESEQIIRLGAIEKHARIWSDSDILIFDSYAWWLDPKFTLLWGAFGSSNAFYTKVVSEKRLYQIVLRTWSDWLEINLNRTRTKLFFMGHSPYHFSSDVWGGKPGNCLGETEIIADEELVEWSRLENVKDLMKVAESTFHKLETRGVKVNYINITHLAAYRKDAHPSIYTTYDKRPKHKKNHKDDAWNSDCLHWCLPGVPDVWNQILYTYIYYGLVRKLFV